MTDFETAARKAAKAAFDVIRHIIAEHPDLFEKTNETHWAARGVLEIEITKHYADLEETYDKLTKLAFIVLQAEFVWADMRTERRIQEMMIDPAIAALLAEKKG